MLARCAYLKTACERYNGQLLSKTTIVQLVENDSLEDAHELDLENTCDNRYLFNESTIIQ
jgi:hypothetical protein